jgi:hypothetical protein
MVKGYPYRKVYHGTNAEFSLFRNLDQLRQDLKGGQKKEEKFAHHFTDDPELSKQYGDRLIYAQIDISDFKVVNFKGYDWTSDHGEKLDAEVVKAKEEGYKGLLAKNMVDRGKDKESRRIVSNHYLTWTPKTITDVKSGKSLYDGYTNYGHFLNDNPALTEDFIKRVGMKKIFEANSQPGISGITSGSSYAQPTSPAGSDQAIKAYGSKLGMSAQQLSDPKWLNQMRNMQLGQAGATIPPAQPLQMQNPAGSIVSPPTPVPTPLQPATTAPQTEGGKKKKLKEGKIRREGEDKDQSRIDANKPPESTSPTNSWEKHGKLTTTDKVTNQLPGLAGRLSKFFTMSPKTDNNDELPGGGVTTNQKQGGEPSTPSWLNRQATGIGNHDYGADWKAAKDFITGPNMAPKSTPSPKPTTAPNQAPAPKQGGVSLGKYKDFSKSVGDYMKDGAGDRPFTIDDFIDKKGKNVKEQVDFTARSARFMTKSPKAKQAESGDKRKDLPNKEFREQLSYVLMNRTLQLLDRGKFQHEDLDPSQNKMDFRTPTTHAESGNKLKKAKRIQEMLGAQKDADQKRLKGDARNPNTPSQEVGVKVSKAVPTRDLTDGYTGK